jgi:hypothetical protein
MKANSTRNRLAKGQVWKTGAADIEIVGLGKRFIHYRITRLMGRRQVSAQVSGIEAMADYLKTNQARLVEGAASN